MKERYWEAECRTRFLSSDCFAHVRPHQRSSATMEALRKEGRIPLYSALHSEHGVSFMQRLEAVVKECLGEVLEDCPVSESNSLEGCLNALVISLGILKMGKMEIHQEVHIDYYDLIMDGDLLRKVVTNQEDSATLEEWLRAGYVVDVPLSFEGAWYRVGIWNRRRGGRGLR